MQAVWNVITFVIGIGIGIAIGFSFASIKFTGYMTDGWNHIAGVTRDGQLNIGDVVDAFGISVEDSRKRHGRL